MKKFRVPIVQNLEEIVINETTFKPVPIPFEIKSNEFLKFSELDIKNKDTRNLINSLTNSKRAIDCQLDSLLYCYSLYNTSDKIKWDFPTKIKYLKNIGLKIPNTISKVSTLRNDLEHRYKKHTKQQVKESFEIAELFLKSTENHYGYGVSEITAIKNNMNLKIVFQRKPEKILIRKNDEILGEITSAEIDKYFEWLKVIAIVNYHWSKTSGIYNNNNLCASQTILRTTSVSHWWN